ncbi:unnamed protein product [Symbiodinium microadriaticum]|nr:unnamed protein product [Symbiodinium microadriaticum]
MLEMAGANKELLEMADRPEARPVCFNSVIHLDLKYVKEQELRPCGQEVPQLLDHTVVAQEAAEAVARRPRRKTSALRRGLTLFPEVKKEKVFVSDGAKVFTTKPVTAYFKVRSQVFAVDVCSNDSNDVVEAAGRDLDAATMALEVFLFKMKANGKELDPKHFDADERNAFRDLDLKELAAWMENDVVPLCADFLPKKFVRVNKSKPGDSKLNAKSRLVIPGHVDPDLGALRTAWLFDVSTAFLSGKHVGRDLFVRPPGDLQPGELWQLLRSAYGLAEAPRLWYQRAKELLREIGFEEIPFAPSTFVYRIKGGPCSPFSVFTLMMASWWAAVSGNIPRSYLGLQLTYVDHVFTNDMTDYVLAIHPAGKATNLDASLDTAQLKEFKRAKLQVAGIGNHPALVTYFDASLGKSDGVAQRGEAHFVGHPNMFAGEWRSHLRTRGALVTASGTSQPELPFTHALAEGLVKAIAHSMLSRKRTSTPSFSLFKASNSSIPVRPQLQQCGGAPSIRSSDKSTDKRRVTRLQSLPLSLFAMRRHPCNDEITTVERGGHISKMKVTKKLSLAGIRTPSAKPEEKEGDRADDRCVDRELGAVPHRQAVCDYLNATCLADRHIDVHVANPNVPGYLCSGLATGEQQHAPAEELGRQRQDNPEPNTNAKSRQLNAQGLCNMVFVFALPFGDCTNAPQQSFQQLLLGKLAPVCVPLHARSGSDPMQVLDVLCFASSPRSQPSPCSSKPSRKTFRRCPDTAASLTETRQESTTSTGARNIIHGIGPPRPRGNAPQQLLLGKLAPG